MKIEFSELHFASGSEEFSNRKCGMARFVDPRVFAGCWSDSAVFVDVLKVIAQKRTG
jgi:hypothetical protein